RMRPTVHEYWTRRRPDLGETLLKRGVLIFRTASCFSRTGIRGFPRVLPPRCVVRLGRERMGRSVMGGKYRGGIASGMQPRLGLFAALACLGALPMACDDDKKDNANDPATIAQGKETFRNDTFGDEAFWTDTLQMHTVISTAVSPKTALGVGLKVDADALPPG